MNTQKITVKALISASVSKTWQLYTQPEHITQWNFASENWQCPFAENDMKVGGKYLARMEAKDGSFGFDFEAIYSQITEGERFTYSGVDGRVIDVMFAALGDKTELTITFDAEQENSIELQQNGWQAILNNFKKYAEGEFSGKI